MKTVVVSCVNFYVAGPLTVARNFLRALSCTRSFTSGEMRVIVFCHSRGLFGELAHPNLTFIEKPRSRSSWLFRLYYEYVYFHFWSRRREIDLWVSLHDITPRVRARIQVTYCHNPAPFFRGRRTWFSDPRFELFRSFYSFLYRINLASARYVIVQQDWLRKEFHRRFRRPPTTTIVAHPVHDPLSSDATPPRHDKGPALRLVYPAFPRSFKNIGLLVAVMRSLPELPISLYLTFRGDENRYARQIRALAADIPSVHFTGFLSDNELQQLYRESHCLVFPSVLETWGLPLSEFRTTGKPIFAADLPYAHEVLAGYANAAYFDPYEPEDLSRQIRAYFTDRILPVSGPAADPAPPFARTWNELSEMLTSLIA
ncbi:MAG: glycosyltransferase, partial [Nitrospirales bacterium]